MASNVIPEVVVRSILSQEIARSKRYTTPFVLFRVGLATHNNTWQETRADIKAELCSLLQTNLRSADIIGEYGNEFLVILPRTFFEGGVIAAQRLLRNREKWFGSTDDNEVRVIVGSTLYSGEDETAEDLLMKVCFAYEAVALDPYVQPPLMCYEVM